MAGVPVEAKEPVCKSCMECSEPMSANMHNAMLGIEMCHKRGVKPSPMLRRSMTLGASPVKPKDEEQKLSDKKFHTVYEPNFDPASQQHLDFVWVYWAGGAQNDELRWSMRSVKRFYPNSTLWLVGDKPGWYAGNHIAVERVPQQSRRGFRDVLNKIKTACEDSRIADDFIWMMDDIYLIQYVSAEEMKTPRYRGKQHKRRVSSQKRSNGWLELKRESFNAIKEKGLPTFDYCTHLPQYINKAKWLAMWDEFDFANRTLQWELCYGAMHWRKPKPWTPFFRRIGREGHLKLVGPKTKIINNTVGGWCEPLRAMLWNVLSEIPGHEKGDDVSSPLWHNSGQIQQERRDNTLPNKKPWPAWALSLKRLRKNGETGVGDTAQRVASWFGGEYFKAFSKKIGMPCECTNRQNNWNKQYPY